MITREELLGLVGEFTYCWGMTFFIETEKGNFVWKDPSYQGDNTVKIYDGSWNQYREETNLPYGRSKGHHVVGNYCGDQVVLGD